MRRPNSRAAISGDRSFENPHCKHLRNVPWVSLSALMSPVHRGQDFKYSISVFFPVIQDSRKCRQNIQPKRPRRPSLPTLHMSADTQIFETFDSCGSPTYRLDQLVVGTLLESEDNLRAIGQNRPSDEPRLVNHQLDQLIVR